MMRLRAAALLLAALPLAGCAVPYGKIAHASYVADPRCAPTGTDPPPDVTALPLFFVTSRLPDCRTPQVAMLHHRGDQVRFGRVAAPAKIDAKTPVPLAIMANDQWWDNLANAGTSSGGRVILYVHGFRESFATAARDTAQIGRMTGFDGPVIVYSWPSQSKVSAYAVDETNMYWDQANFAGFLKRLAEQAWAKEVIIVSHSLGARLVLPAIEYVDANTADADARNISNIILQAPDIDREDFERSVAIQLLTEAKIMRDRRIHIYVSARDRALALSRRIHGYPRLGSPYCFNPNDPAALRLPGENARCYPGTGATAIRPDRAGIYVIDTTDVTRGTSGHSNFLQSAVACEDFIAVVGGARSAPRRVPTHLRHVFRLTRDPADPKPDHVARCKIAP
jgi:esterase/lipase superfamily enzyme